MNEEWRDIEGYEGLYQVSNLGRVKSLNYRGCKGNISILKPRLTKKGYETINLCKDGKVKNVRIHRLVAQSFISNPNNLPVVNHKDENKLNNNVDNLEWCTCQDNLLHSFRVLNRKPSITNAKIIKLTNKQTGKVLYFSTEKDCAFYLNMSYEHLNKLLTGYHDISKWKKGTIYKVEYSDIEDVTTIPVGSTE